MVFSKETMKSVLLCLSAGFWLRVFYSTKGLFKTSPSVLINCRPGGRRAQWGWWGSCLVSILRADHMWKHSWLPALGPLCSSCSCQPWGASASFDGHSLFIDWPPVCHPGAHWGHLYAGSSFVLAKEDENPPKNPPPPTLSPSDIGLCDTFGDKLPIHST